MNEATIARDEAIANVEGGADVRFMHAALAAIEQAAKAHQEFTTDDVEPLCMLSPEEPRSWGAAMMRAAKSGIIERTDRTRQSKSRVCHAREKRLWRSLIYQAPQPREGLFEDAPMSSYGKGI